VRSTETVPRNELHVSFIHLFVHPSMALQPFVGPWALLHLRNLFYTDSRASLEE
jgi:hypothetical protein